MKTVSVHASTNYDILIEKGLLDRCGDLAAQVFSCGSKAAIITDDTVAELYLQRVKSSLERRGYTVSTYIFSHGENSKSAETLFAVYNFLI